MTRHADAIADSEISFENAAGLYPAPWRIEINPGTNRAAIFDKSGALILRGMNTTKARVIIGAVNRDSRANAG